MTATSETLVIASVTSLITSAFFLSASRAASAMKSRHALRQPGIFSAQAASSARRFSATDRDNSTLPPFLMVLRHRCKVLRVIEYFLHVAFGSPVVLSSRIFACISGVHSRLVRLRFTASPPRPIAPAPLA